MTKPPRDKFQDEMRRIARSGDPLSGMHREIVGNAVRIHVPLADVISLRAIAAHFRKLANELDVLSRSAEEQWIVLNVAKGRIKACDASVRAEVKR